MDLWNEIESGEIFIFDLDDSPEIIGKLKTVREGQFGNKVYDLETKEGDKTVFGTAILDSKMESVKLNSEVKIVYLGEIKTKNGWMAKNFKVYTK